MSSYFLIAIFFNPLSHSLGNETPTNKKVCRGSVSKLGDIRFEFSFFDFENIPEDTTLYIAIVLPGGTIESNH